MHDPRKYSAILQQVKVHRHVHETHLPPAAYYIAGSSWDIQAVSCLYAKPVTVIQAIFRTPFQCINNAVMLPRQRIFIAGPSRRRQKQIDPLTVSQSMKVIDETEYTDALRRILKSKCRGLKAVARYKHAGERRCMC